MKCVHCKKEHRDVQLIAVGKKWVKECRDLVECASNQMDEYLASDQPWRDSVIKVEKTGRYPDVKLPTRGSAHAAGFDFYLGDTITIMPKATAKVPTGLRCKLPAGMFGDIRARSSATINRLHIVGVVDNDYRGEIFLAVHNLGESAVTIEKGQRIAQMLVLNDSSDLYVEEGTVDDVTVRGSGSFGSSGK